MFLSVSFYYHFSGRRRGGVYVPTNDCDREVHACSDFLNLKVVGRYWVRCMKGSSVQLSAIFKCCRLGKVEKIGRKNN